MNSLPETNSELPFERFDGEGPEGWPLIQRTNAVELNSFL